MASTAPKDETYEAFRSRFDGAIITTYVVAMLVVPLKIWCRKRAGGWSIMGADEIFTLCGAAFVTGTFAVIYSAVRPLLGKKIADVMQSPEDMAKLPAFALYLWVANLLYTISVMFMKLSIVALYWRLFGLTRKGRIPLLLVGGVIVAWGITVFLIVIFNCDPIAGSWDLTLATTAKCVDKKSFYVGGSVPNVITDLVLVIMPLPYVWRLHASVAQRIVLGGIFALGMFVSIVSMIRLSVLLDTAGGVFDVTYTFKDVYMWSLVEINVGLTCACLPSLRPLVKVIGLRRLFSSGRSRPSGAATPEPSQGLSGNVSGLNSRRKPKGMFSQLEDDDEFEMIPEDKMKGGAWSGGSTSRVSHDTDRTSNGSTDSRKQAAIGAIVVQRDFEVSSSRP
ncbi:hypothetical protein DPSP01_013239 [Paraphaeosphaeria sporulosa]|uniref:Rhodopsin domain-containing protein n=1 Tax=Paraphaeosphaeria sporulosa TaxID=1460663 RepID=A0A177CAX7_9PLEO|nr:uncharacterized protein CC84DRAFT_1147535 [Paraphaeosphaeria sporulosa]OAG04725.1 hypothetical protein CC84DRAFT_1147535 [Paraphaeosphaeria sporulosa]